MAGRRPKQAIQRRGTSPFSTPTRWHLSPRRKKRRSQGMEYQPILVRERTTIGQRANHYWSRDEPILVTTATNIGSHHPSIETPRRSRTERAHTLIAKRDTPSYAAYPIKNESQAPALLRESWRLAVFGWRGAIAPRRSTPLSTHKRNCASYSQAFEGG